MSVLSGSLVARVGEIITRYSMLSRGERIGVAVSGGADSVSLLHLLHRLRAQFAVTLAVLHVNHGLRGQESDDDEAFVREISASLGHPFILQRADPGPGNVEQEARNLRRTFFRTTMAQHGLGRVALGHTLDDQAETVLFRFLRGTGATGISGMRPVTADGLIRPLLPVLRNEVRAWAEAEGIQWREDSTNADRRFTRNKLRNELFPALEREYNPKLNVVLAGAAEVAQNEEDFWNEHAESMFGRAARRTQLGLIFSVDGLRALGPAVRRRIIRRALADIRGDLRSLDREHVEAVCRICESAYGHDRATVPAADAIRSFGTLLITTAGKLNEQPREYEFPVNFSEEIRLPGDGGVFRVDWMNPGTRNCANFKEVQEVSPEIYMLDGDRIASQGRPFRLFLRNWQPGDSIVRLGHHKPDKVKTLFQEHRILLWERRHWPVLICDGQVVWVRRFGVSEPFAAAEGAERPVQVTFMPAEL